MKFIHQHADYISSADGRKYAAQVYAAKREDHTWEAWCVFFPEKGDDFVAGGRETTQSTAESVRYWTSGLTHRFFEGALDRALTLDRDADLDRQERAAETAAYAQAAVLARERAHELEVMKRAMRRGIRFG